MNILRLAPLLMLPVALAFTGCNESMASVASEAPVGSGAVAFRFSAVQAESLATEVDTIEVVLDDGAQKRTLRTKLSGEVEFSDLPTGNWKLTVTLRRGGVAKYQGSTLVAIESGRTTEAKVVLSAVSGGLKVEIGFAHEGAVASHPSALLGSWVLSYLPTVDTLVILPTLRFESNGTVWIDGVCGGEHKGSWMADSNLLWIEEGVATTDLMNCKIGGDIAVAMTTVHKLFGKPIGWKVRTDTVSLELTDPKADTVIAVFDPFHATGGLKASTKDLEGTWYLSELGGMLPITDTIPLVLASNGTASGSDGCNHWTGKWSAPSDSTIRIVFGATTLKACLDSAGDMVDKGYTKPLSGEVVWKVERLYGTAGENRQLTLRDPKTNTVMARYRNDPPFTKHTPVIPPHLVRDPMSLVGVWGLVSMPIEGLDSASGSMLVFDSLGRVSGTIGCNSGSSTWSLDNDGRLVIKPFASTKMACQDSVQMLIERGIHLLTSLPLDWTLDSASAVTGQQTITVYSSITGVKAAVFSVSRFGVAYASTLADTTLVRPIQRPVYMPDPGIM